MESKGLKAYMQEHFNYTQLKNIGFFTKEMKGDYESQAARVCLFFGYETVYEYSRHEIRGHISHAGKWPLHINRKGELVGEPFVSVIFPNQLHV